MREMFLCGVSTRKVQEVVEPLLGDGVSAQTVSRICRSLDEEVARFRTWAARWRAIAPKAVRCLQDDLEQLLAFLGCPPAHWKKVRTPNAIERAFREVRRRTRPMSCFQNPASVDRIIFGVVSHLNASWKEKPLPEFTHNS